MRNRLLLVTPLLAAACSYPQFKASRSVDLDVSLAEAERLSCASHNGDIEVTTTADQDATTIRVHADIEVRGFTQEEADRNLDLVAVGHALEGTTLRVFGEFDRSDFRRATPSFAFRLRVPPSLALQLESHNGNVHTVGDAGTGAVSIETHNGRVHGELSTAEATVETHNGDIELTMRQGGPLEATLTTHNGDVQLELAEGTRATIEAHTHNGRIQPPSTLHDAEFGRRHLRCRIGESPPEGHIELTTHNGNIDVGSPGRRPN